MNMDQISQWLSQMVPSRTNADDKEKNALGAPGLDGTGVAGIDGVQPHEKFGGLMNKAVDAVQQPAAAASAAVEKFTRGSEGEIHQTMMSLERGDVSFKFFVTAKNKAIEAYKELMRMG